MFKSKSGAGGPEISPRAPWVTSISIIKFLVLLVMFLIVAFFAMVIWHQTNPVTIKEPVYIEFQTAGNNFVVLSRAGEDITSNQLLVSREMRRYVMLREPITKADETERYPQVMSLSCGSVASIFKKTYGGPDGPFLREGLKREVMIMRDNRVADGVHQVEFSMRDWIEGRTKREDAKPSTWVATVAYSFDEKRKTLDKQGLNPMGICINEYSVTRWGRE